MLGAFHQAVAAAALAAAGCLVPSPSRGAAAEAPAGNVVVTGASRVAAFDPAMPSRQIGWFTPGSRLEREGDAGNGFVRVLYRPPSGAPVRALCRAADLGPAPGAAPAGEAQDTPAMNALLGLDLWADGSLWDDADVDAAGRLGWPEESRTSYGASYRRYAGAGEKVLGARPYSLALYGEEGLASQVSIVFANKGDALQFVMLSDDRRARRDAIKSFGATLESDAETIGAALEARLGPSSRAVYGDRKLREVVRRWDWAGHALLLAVKENEYVGLRIVPAEVADSRGRADRMTDTELKKILATRVDRRPNGDVLVTDLPMVDQGPKGFCVPATWERYLRFMGIPADMYVLAMAGGTDFGGGTDVEWMKENVASLVTRYHRRLKDVSQHLRLATVRKYIDDGLPLMWTVEHDEWLSGQISRRTARRAGMTDPEAWSATLEPVRKEARRFKPEGGGHLCMIIGYNERTGELAVTDSWGPAFAERWMTVEEADAIHRGTLSVVTW